MGTAYDHEYEYNPRLAVGEVDPYFERAAKASHAARLRLRGELDIRYGKHPLMTCDIFLAAAADAPVHAFVHGGYWRGRDKADYSYIAELLNDAGITAVIVNYDLCPTVSLPVIVDEIAVFLSWLPGALSTRGMEPTRLTLSGHSAGAHLIAMAYSVMRNRALDVTHIDHAMLVSGIYDLQPVLAVSVNEIIGLDGSTAAAMSPLEHLPHEMTCDVVVGGAETGSWIEQSRLFAGRMQEAGGTAYLTIAEGQNHFSIMEDFADANRQLGRRLIEIALG